ncbi:MAG: hypothetical protein WD069_16865 [Planctomycetales bacterium]
MDFLRNLSRSVILLAAAGLATGSLGCAEKPQATSGNGVESGSATRPGVSVQDDVAPPAGTPSSPTEPENPPLRAPGLAPGPGEKQEPAASEADTTPLPE